MRNVVADESGVPSIDGPFSINYLWDEGSAKATGLTEVSRVGRKFEFENTMQTQGRVAAILQRDVFYATGAPLSFVNWEVNNFEHPDFMAVMTTFEQAEYKSTFEGYWFKTAKSKYDILQAAIRRRQAQLGAKPVR